MRNLWLVLCILLAGAFNVQGQGTKPPIYYFNPDWSRDGKTIYFISDRDGSPQIYAMKMDGSKARKIVDGSIVSNPNISRDGNTLHIRKR